MIHQGKATIEGREFGEPGGVSPRRVERQKKTRESQFPGFPLPAVESLLLRSGSIIPRKSQNLLHYHCTGRIRLAASIKPKTTPKVKTPRRIQGARFSPHRWRIQAPFRVSNSNQAHFQRPTAEKIAIEQPISN